MKNNHKQQMWVVKCDDETHHYYSRTHRFPSLKYCLKNQLLITICEEAWGMRGVTNLYLCHLVFFCNYQLGLMPVVL